MVQFCPIVGCILRPPYNLFNLDKHLTQKITHHGSELKSFKSSTITLLLEVSSVLSPLFTKQQRLSMVDFILLSPLPPGKPSAWCVRLFQWPKEPRARERYAFGRSDGGVREEGRDGDGVIGPSRDRAEHKNIIERYSSRGKQEETAALDIHSPVRVLFIASPL